MGFCCLFDSCSKVKSMFFSFNRTYLNQKAQYFKNNFQIHQQLFTCLAPTQIALSDNIISSLRNFQTLNRYRLEQPDLILGLASAQAPSNQSFSAIHISPMGFKFNLCTELEPFILDIPTVQLSAEQLPCFEQYQDLGCFKAKAHSCMQSWLAE